MPLHPAIVHLPLALTFLLPVLVLVFAWAMKNGKMSKELWGVIVGIQILITATGYISLETGETDEEKVSTVVSKKIIHEHEEAAEIFVGTTVISLAAGIITLFLQPAFQDKARFAVVFLSLLPVFFGWQAGKLGGEIVYKHGGASAHSDVREVLRVETPETAPAHGPESDNESLNADDNDYSGENVPEEEMKSED